MVQDRVGQGVTYGRSQVSGAAFRKTVAYWLPDLPLARAIANTVKHDTYRDEGLGDADPRLAPRLSKMQHERLRLRRGTVTLDEAFATAAAQADFSISFERSGQAVGTDAGTFVEGLDQGMLRLLDAGAGFEDFVDPLGCTTPAAVGGNSNSAGDA